MSLLFLLSATDSKEIVLLRFVFLIRSWRASEQSSAFFDYLLPKKRLAHNWLTGHTTKQIRTENTHRLCRSLPVERGSTVENIGILLWGIHLESRLNHHRESLRSCTCTLKKWKLRLTCLWFKRGLYEPLISLLVIRKDRLLMHYSAHTRSTKNTRR